MKPSSSLTLLAPFLVGPAFAFDVPKSAHRADEVDKAIAEATKSKRGLIFVASDSSLKPSWATCSGTVSLAVLKEVRSIGEVVFVDSGQSGNVPENIRSQLSGTIPVVVIADPKGEKVYGRYDHSVLKTKDFSSIFRQARRDLRDDLKNGVVLSEADKPGGGSDSDAPGKESGSSGKSASSTKEAPDFESWKSIKGSVIEAKFESLQGDDVTLKTKDGRSIKLKRYQLSAESQRRLKELAG